MKDISMRRMLVSLALLAVLGCRGAMKTGGTDGAAGSGDTALADGGTGGSSGGTGATLSADRSVVNLGTLDVGQTGMATVKVTNTGTAPSGTMSLGATPGLTATGCDGVLAPGASCTIVITATPTAVGAFSGTVSLSANPGAITPLQISVTTMTGGGVFFVTPPTFDLGTVLVGAAVPPQPITIHTSVTISDLAFAASGPDVSIDWVASTCTAVLAADASCTVVVNFVAAAAGVRSDSIVISAGGANGKVVTVLVTAIVQSPAKLTINPSGPQSLVASVGQTSAPITFGLVNAGDTPTGTIAAEITGANATDFIITSTTCTTLAPLATCTISVVVNATALAAVSPTATLTVTESSSGSSVSVELSCWCGRPPGLVITPATSDLGTVVIGTTGPATVFTLTNTGDTATGTLTATVSNAEFVITGDTCSGALLVARTGSCTVSVALAPKTAGTKTATLKIADAIGHPAVKSLTGVGVAGFDAGAGLDAGAPLDAGPALD
jgi:hypothetical protein